MATAKDSNKLCADNLPSELLAVIGIHFAKQDMAMDIYGSQKTLFLLRGYYEEVSALANIAVEVTALKGAVRVYQQRVRDMLEFALSKEATPDHVRKAQTALNLAGQAVERMEHLATLLDGEDWRLPDADR